MTKLFLPITIWCAMLLGSQCRADEAGILLSSNERPERTMCFYPENQFESDAFPVKAGPVSATLAFTIQSLPSAGYLTVTLTQNGMPVASKTIYPQTHLPHSVVVNLNANVASGRIRGHTKAEWTGYWHQGIGSLTYVSPW